jgi:hypothetical protein
MADIQLNESRFLPLLEKLIGESQHVQNDPPTFVPQVGALAYTLIPNYGEIETFEAFEIS